MNSPVAVVPMYVAPQLEGVAWAFGREMLPGEEDTRVPCHLIDRPSSFRRLAPALNERAARPIFTLAEEAEEAEGAWRRSIITHAGPNTRNGNKRERGRGESLHGACILLILLFREERSSQDWALR